MSLNNKPAESKYNVKLPISGVPGILYTQGSEEIPCHVETQLRIEVTGVGPLNEIQVYGRIRSSSLWHYIATVTGPVTGTADISTYDFIRYLNTVPDGPGELIASGFIFSGGGSSVTNWGTILGTLSNQTDLQSALDAKEDESNKAISLAAPDDIKYPTTKAVSDALALISGTVGSVSVATANGFSGTVTNPTTTPEITIVDNYFTHGRNTTAPNTTVPVHSLTSVGSETDIDSAIAPKGQGGFSLQVADGTTAGGNKRGPQSTDLQMSRTGAAQVASGAQSFAAGIRNTASSSTSVAIGSTNTSSGARAIAGGFGCTASGQDSVAIGNNNTASGVNSFATGGGAHTNGVYGRYSHAATYLAAFGDSQWSMFSLRQSTTGATPTTMTSNAAVEAATNTVNLTNQTSFFFKGEIVAKQSGSTNAAVWKIEGFITRGANAAATTLVTSSVTAYSNVPAWTSPTLAANTTLGGLSVTVTGAAATNIRWFANIETSEILYA